MKFLKAGICLCVEYFPRESGEIAIGTLGTKQNRQKRKFVVGIMLVNAVVEICLFDFKNTCKTERTLGNFQ